MENTSTPSTRSKPTPFQESVGSDINQTDSHKDPDKPLFFWLGSDPDEDLDREYELYLFKRRLFIALSILIIGGLVMLAPLVLAPRPEFIKAVTEFFSHF